MKLTKTDIENLQQRYRATLINSLSGVRQQVLVGTKSKDGLTNLAIFNSILHIGAHPAMYGLLFRPDTVRRDTLTNILETNSYTINYPKSSDYKKAHQTSAKYDHDVSEFGATGFTETYRSGIYAPFADEAPVKIGMTFAQRVDIPLNGTMMIIGSIETIEFDEKLLSDDGYVALDKADILAGCGLDSYFSVQPIGRLSYAKPDRDPQPLTT